MTSDAITPAPRPRRPRRPPGLPWSPRTAAAGRAARTRRGPLRAPAQRVHRLTRRVSTGAAVGAALVAVGGLLPDLVLAPLAIALAVGLPHGAVDHLVLMRRLGGTRGVAVGTVGYVGAAAVTFWIAGVAPLPVWTAFLLLSVWHFGTADREYLALTGDRPSLVFALAAGFVPVAGLMVRGADTLRPVAAALDPTVVGLLTPPVLTAVTVAGATVVLAALVVEGRLRRRRPTVELVILVALFLTAPPLWAFGVYFGLWHALRHVTRMVAEEEPWATLLTRRGAGSALRRFVRDAVPPSGAALAAGAALAVLGRDVGAVALTALALQVTAAVTFPHAATVAFLDRAVARRGSVRRTARGADGRVPS